MNVYKKIGISVMCIVYTQTHAFPAASAGLAVVQPQPISQQSSSAATQAAQNKSVAAPKALTTTSSTTTTPSTKVSTVLTTQSGASTSLSSSSGASKISPQKIPTTVTPIQATTSTTLAQKQTAQGNPSKLTKKIIWGKPFGGLHNKIRDTTKNNRLSATPIKNN